MSGHRKWRGGRKEIKSAAEAAAYDAAVEAQAAEYAAEDERLSKEPDESREYQGPGCSPGCGC